jgi:hypothetical protein
MERDVTNDRALRLACRNWIAAAGHARGMTVHRTTELLRRVESMGALRDVLLRGDLEHIRAVYRFATRLDREQR